MTILEKQPALLVNKNIDHDFTAWLVCSWLTQKDVKPNLFLYVLFGQL